MIVVGLDLSLTSTGIAKIDVPSRAAAATFAVRHGLG